MAFDKKPQTWLGAAVKVESGVSHTVYRDTGNRLYLGGGGLGAIPFLSKDDPVYFTTSFGTVAANTIYYLGDLITSSGYYFQLYNKPSWEASPVLQTFSSNVTGFELYIPARVSFLLQNTGITGLPAGAMSTFSVSNASRPGGDIRYYYLELCKLLKKIWDSTNSNDRPKRIRADSHDFLAEPGTATRNYIFETDLDYATTAVKPEPAV